MKWLNLLVDRRVALLVGGSALLLDLLSKELVTTLLPEGSQVTAGPLMIQHARNPGVALGTFGGLSEGVRMSLVVVGMLVALFVALPWLARRLRAGALKQTAVALVITGAIGNFADRLRYGSVIDFIGLDPALGIPSPVFNLADVAIVVGAALLLWGPKRTGPGRGQPLPQDSWPGISESNPGTQDSSWTIIAVRRAPTKEVVASSIKLLGVLLAVSVALGAPKAQAQGDAQAGQVASMNAQMRMIRQAVQAYHLQHKRHPEQLEALASPPEGQPFLKAQHLIDPWGIPYTYQVRGEALDIISAGHDGKLGSDDDVMLVGNTLKHQGPIDFSPRPAPKKSNTLPLALIGGFTVVSLVAWRMLLAKKAKADALA
ncbi:MAG: signal peptidase II [Bradymonadia bacterium]